MLATSVICAGSALHNRCVESIATFKVLAEMWPEPAVLTTRYGDRLNVIAFSKAAADVALDDGEKTKKSTQQFNAFHPLIRFVNCAAGTTIALRKRTTGNSNEKIRNAPILLVSTKLFLCC